MHITLFNRGFFVPLKEMGFIKVNYMTGDPIQRLFAIASHDIEVAVCYIKSVPAPFKELENEESL